MIRSYEKIIKSFKNKLKNSELASKIFNALLNSAGIRILGMALGFFVGVQLARNLGTEGYGMYSLVMSIIALMTVPTEFGVPQLTIREVAKSNANGEWSTFKGIFVWSNRVVVVVFTILLFGLFILSKLELGIMDDSIFNTTLLYGVLIVPLIALMRIRAAALMGLQKITTGQIPDIVLRPLLFSLSLFICFNVMNNQASPNTVMLLQLVSLCVVLVVAIFLLKQNIPVDLTQIKAKLESKKWMASSIPMALTEGIRVFQGHLALLILGFFISLTDVSIFKVAVSISALIAMPISLINIVSASIVSDLYSKGEVRKLAKMAPLMARLMVLGIGLLILPFIFFGEELITWVFGKGYTESVVILLIISTGYLINAFFGINAILLNMTKHEKRVTKAFLYSLIINIILSIGLIYELGIIGAALANSLGLLVWNILMWLDVKKLLKINSTALNK